MLFLWKVNRFDCACIIILYCKWSYSTALTIALMFYSRTSRMLEYERRIFFFYYISDHMQFVLRKEIPLQIVGRLLYCECAARGKCVHVNCFLVNCVRRKIAKHWWLHVPLVQLAQYLDCIPQVAFQRCKPRSANYWAALASVPLTCCSSSNAEFRLHGEKRTCDLFHVVIPSVTLKIYVMQHAAKFWGCDWRNLSRNLCIFWKKPANWAFT